MIERHDDDGIVTLRLAHGKASALDAELLEAMERSLDDVARSDARAVVLTGSGSIFSAGVDLFRLVEEGAPYVERFFPLLVSAIRKLFLFPRPVVAAANGHAIAGGCVLVLACDYRIMAAGKGRIGMPEFAVGVPFPAMILEIIRFAVAPQHLQHIVYSAGTFTPDEALTKGLIDEVAPADTLEARAGEMARKLAAFPADGFRLAKSQLRSQAVERAGRFAAADTEALELWSRPQTRDVIRAYLERTVGKK
jgi:enoyl-CoA hydratase